MTWVIGSQKRRKKIREAVKEPEYAAVRVAKKTLKRMRIRLPPRPMKGDVPLEPILPSDLTRLNDRQLGRLYSEFCAMAQYVKLRLAIHAIESAVARQVEKMHRAEARLHVRGKSGTITAEVEVDPTVRRKTVNALVADGVQTLSTAIFESYLIGKEACSREMTRRSWADKDPNPVR